MRNGIVIALALAAGVLLAAYDLRTDDSGIEVGLLLIAAVVLTTFAPRRWWLIALCVGLPIPAAEIVIAHSSLPPAGIAALAVTIVGTVIGSVIVRAATVSAAG